LSAKRYYEVLCIKHAPIKEFTLVPVPLSGRYMILRRTEYKAGEMTTKAIYYVLAPLGKGRCASLAYSARRMSVPEELAAISRKIGKEWLRPSQTLTEARPSAKWNGIQTVRNWQGCMHTHDDWRQGHSIFRPSQAKVG
jgi:hypothetical protein